MTENSKGIRRINAIDEIPNSKYVGYYWMSDQEKPEQVNGDFAPKLKGLNPFIIEAMLWDEASEKSIMITHMGRYQIFEYDLKRLASEGALEDKFYMPHRLDGIKKVKFKQFWKAEKDSLCNDYSVLTLKAQIFVGFE